MSRPVDNAMGDERAEKRAVRGIWAEKIRAYDERYPGPDDVLYLTLSGGDGRDIRFLMEEGIVDSTEVGGIGDLYARRVVAIESSPRAVTQLQSQIPGLKIVDGTISGLVRGNKFIRFPDGEEEDICRARVVNLDLNCPLLALDENDPPEFHVISWIRKFAELHAAAPRKPWCLLLTLHAEIRWTEDLQASAQALLRENLEISPEFRATTAGLLGQDRANELAEPQPFAFAALGRDDQQKVLMLYVAKKVIQACTGWTVVTERTIRYGRAGHAPMVTWVFAFEWDAALAQTPILLYRRNVQSIGARLERLDDRGRAHPDAP